MGKKIFKIVALIILIACNPSRHASKPISTEIKIHVNDSIKLGDPVLFELENISSNPITVFNPERLRIEKLTDQKWQKLKILECLCDAPCQPSADFAKLESGRNIKLRWDQKEKWCGSRTNKQIRETIISPVEKGKYRIIVNYKKASGEETSSSKEFIIN